MFIYLYWRGVADSRVDNCHRQCTVGFDQSDSQVHIVLFQCCIALVNIYRVY